jgi:hypothetical protein
MPQDTPAEILKDAELLVAYVVRAGIVIDQTLIDQIVDAKAKIEGGTLTPAEESAFYHTVNTLTAKLAPVSAETLRACTEEFGVVKKTLFTRRPFKCSQARVSVRRQRAWALFALGLLLVAQTYWLIGSNVISRIPSLDENVPPPTATTAQAAEDKKAAEEKLMADTKEVTRYWVLRIWSTPWKWLPDWLASHVSAEDNRQAAARGDFFEWGFEAKEVLAIFQIYLLPLLYGWVGAMAYVLRRMIKAVQDMTYRGVLDVEFSLRVYLGVLAGVAIGWFFKPDTTNAAGTAVTLTSLTPFALSFVAGYSVELLFTAMDRLVGAFTEKKSETTP